HGVMNTDNMSILGLTIDYGPYGWLEDYDPNWTPNTTDAGQRRYRFGQQPQIALWNLTQLANAIYPLIEQVEPLQDALNVYSEGFNQGWKSMMAGKLGLHAFEPETDDALITDLQTVLQVAETDMTLFYRKLAQVDTSAEPPRSDAALMEPLLDAYYNPEQLTVENQARIGNWLQRYITRVRQDRVPDEVRRDRMNAVNPKYVLRNYLAQLAIDQAEQGDYSIVRELQEVLRRPYDEQPEQEAYAQKRPDWARHRAGCSMLSCSS
ncbi:MAG: protein adenylyltransferase SelO family protein, partial [Candidatus Tectomicrobia bacterium]|nr:protein adenylyltransferase SelO family protein [Candidatus Tectomicrobia bacterium]